jgi:hypothetical protein
MRRARRRCRRAAPIETTDRRRTAPATDKSGETLMASASQKSQREVSTKTWR